MFSDLCYTITQTLYYHTEVIISQRHDTITQTSYYCTNMILSHRRDTWFKNAFTDRFLYYHTDMILSQRGDTLTEVILSHRHETIKQR